MPDRTPRLYWDANVFLSYVDGVPDRLPDIDALFREAEQGRVEIVTSTASITEVAFGSIEMDQRALSPEVQQKIEGLWLPTSPVKLVEVSVLVVEGARAIMRSAIPEGTKVPKPMDAVHLSTAVRMGADVFHSYDAPLRKIAARIGVASTEPSASSPLLFSD